MSKPLPCVFVGGPIQNAIDPGGLFNEEIRQLITSVLIALKKINCHIISAHVYENFGEMNVRGKFQDVCARDYQWMRECDLFLAILPLDSNGKVICTSGTFVELGWASAMGKPIVIVRDPAPKYSHLIAGLNVVTQVAEVYINEKNFDEILFHTIAQMLKQELADYKLLEEL